MRISLVIISTLLFISVQAQKSNQYIQKGNDDYKLREYSKADEEYSKALKADGKNKIAQFNSGNAKHKLNKYEDAAKQYEAAAKSSNDPIFQSEAYNNLGLAYIRQKKLQEAIGAFKQSLRLNSNDKETRENLQKALKELQQQQSKNNDKQDDKKKKNPKDKDQQDKNKSKLNKDQAENLLNNLQKEEKNLQKQVQKKNQSLRQLKDW